MSNWSCSREFVSTKSRPRCEADELNVCVAARVTGGCVGARVTKLDEGFKNKIFHVDVKDMFNRCNNVIIHVLQSLGVILCVIRGTQRCVNPQTTHTPKDSQRYPKCAVSEIG